MKLRHFPTLAATVRIPCLPATLLPVRSGRVWTGRGKASPAAVPGSVLFNFRSVARPGARKSLCVGLTILAGMLAFPPGAASGGGPGRDCVDWMWSINSPDPGAFWRQATAAQVWRCRDYFHAPGRQCRATAALPPRCRAAAASLDLFVASLQGEAKRVKTLIAAGARIEARDNRHNTPLHYAAAKGRTAAVRILIAAGAAIEARNRKYMTPLHFAAQLGRTATVKALLAAGAHIEARDSESDTEPARTALHYAAMSNETATVEALIAAGANVNARDGYDFNSPLHYAKSGTVAQALIAAGADIEAVGQSNWTPLHAAGNPEAAKALIAAGADVNRASKYGNMPLHAAGGDGNLAVLKILIAAGAKVDARNTDGETPLHIAAEEGHANTATALLDAGADGAARTEKGATPFELARTHNMEKLRGTVAWRRLRDARSR